MVEVEMRLVEVQLHWANNQVKVYLSSCWGHGRVSSLPVLLLSRPDHSVYTVSEPINKQCFP